MRKVTLNRNFLRAFLQLWAVLNSRLALWNIISCQNNTMLDRIGGRSARLCVLSLLRQAVSFAVSWLK